jgi:hypothetical protein
MMDETGKFWALITRNYKMAFLSGRLRFLKITAIKR